MPFDFYLPDYNLCIEYQGKQHFTDKFFFGGKDRLLDQQKKDNIKRNWCSLPNNPDLLEIRYDEDIIEKLKSVLHPLI